MIIGEVGDDPDVKDLVYVAAFQPDVGESIGVLSAFMQSDLPNDALLVFDDGQYLVNEDAWISFVANGLDDAEAAFSARSQATSNV